MTAAESLEILRGTVRPLSVLGALVIAGLCLLMGKAVPEWFVGLITLVVRDYFASREKGQS